MVLSISLFDFFFFDYREKLYGSGPHSGHPECMRIDEQFELICIFLRNLSKLDAASFGRKVLCIYVINMRYVQINVTDDSAGDIVKME